MSTAPDWTQDPEQVARWRYWIEHDPDAKSWPPPRTRGRVMEPIDIAHAALIEVGRRDLADWIHGWEDDDGFYLEYDDDILSEADWAVIDRAETIARQSVGLAARSRCSDSAPREAVS